MKISIDISPTKDGNHTWEIRVNGRTIIEGDEYETVREAVETAQAETIAYIEENK